MIEDKHNSMAQGRISLRLAGASADTNPKQSGPGSLPGRHNPATLAESGGQGGLNVSKCLLISGLFLILTASGCSRGVGWWDERDRKEPLMQRAIARVAEGDVDGAIAAYSKALDIDHSLVRAHLDLALLLHDYKKDYVGAIYHYKRYLALRPDTQKQDMITERMMKARQLFAARINQELPGRQPPPELPAVKPARPESTRDAERDPILERRLEAARRESAETREALEAQKQKDAALLKHNESLQQEILRLRQALAAEAAQDQPRTYRVQKGDTLSSIAVRFYRDANRWREILKANEDRLGSTKRLRVGQVIVIP